MQRRSTAASNVGENGLCGDVALRIGRDNKASGESSDSSLAVEARVGDLTRRPLALCGLVLRKNDRVDHVDDAILAWDDGTVYVFQQSQLMLLRSATKRTVRLFLNPDSETIQSIGRGRDSCL